MTDIFVRQQSAIEVARKLQKHSVFDTKPLRPCEEDPPRFSSKDCAQCRDPCGEDDIQKPERQKE